MIPLLSWTETTDRDGLLWLYFNRELPESFSREKNTKSQYYCEPGLEIAVYL